MDSAMSVIDWNWRGDQLHRPLLGAQSLIGTVYGCASLVESLVKVPDTSALHNFNRNLEYLLADQLLHPAAILKNYVRPR